MTQFFINKQLVISNDDNNEVIIITEGEFENVDLISKKENGEVHKTFSMPVDEAEQVAKALLETIKHIKEKHV
jgi:hypothetical protein